MGGIKGLRTARGLKNLGLGGNFVKGGGGEVSTPLHAMDELPERLQ